MHASCTFQDIMYGEEGMVRSGVIRLTSYATHLGTMSLPSTTEVMKSREKLATGRLKKEGLMSQSYLSAESSILSY